MRHEYNSYSSTTEQNLNHSFFSFLFFYQSITLKEEKLGCVSSLAGEIQRAERARPETGRHPQPAGRQASLGGESGLRADSHHPAQEKGS